VPRPRKPTTLKILAGDREDRINRNEPMPAEGETLPPVPLSDGAQKVWNRLAPDLEAKGCLSTWDLDMFAVYCNAAATYYEVSERIGSEYVSEGSAKNTVVSPLWRVLKDAAETMRVVGAKFGLTPSDRAGLDTSENVPSGGVERFFG
jgi:P27 family predicted phage terminase small subunit